MDIKFKKLDKGLPDPFIATEGSAGIDLFCSRIDSLDKTKSCMVIATGVAVEIPKQHVGLLLLRSSLGKKGLSLANNVGVIDSDYRGELLLNVKYIEDDIYAPRVAERIAQLVIVPHPAYSVVFTEELSGTERGTGGFGSTGE